MSLDAMYPVCAVCKKPVDTLVWYDNPMNGNCRFIAKCHGETETMELRLCDVERMSGSDVITGGVAFVLKPILTHEVHK